MSAQASPKTANQLLKAQSIEAILNAAGQCYLEKGLSGTTVDDIAARAKVGRATVFRNFKTKEAIFVEYMQRECREITERLSRILESAKSPEDYITTLLLFIICDGPKEPVFKIAHEDYQSRAYTFDLDFFSLTGDKLLEATLPPFYEMAKQNDQLRKGVTLEKMISWIKRLSISFAQDPMADSDNPKRVKEYLMIWAVPSLFKD